MSEFPKYRGNDRSPDARRANPRSGVDRELKYKGTEVKPQTLPTQQQSKN